MYGDHVTIHFLCSSSGVIRFDFDLLFQDQITYCECQFFIFTDARKPSHTGNDMLPSLGGVTLGH